MRIKVYISFLGKTKLLDENNMLELPEGSRVSDLYRILKISFPLRAFPVYVNHMKASSGQVLYEDDNVAFPGLNVGG